MIPCNSLNYILVSTTWWEQVLWLQSWPLESVCRVGSCGGRRGAFPVQLSDIALQNVFSFVWHTLQDKVPLVILGKEPSSKDAPQDQWCDYVLNSPEGCQQYLCNACQTLSSFPVIWRTKINSLMPRSRRVVILPDPMQLVLLLLNNSQWNT